MTETIDDGLHASTGARHSAGRWLAPATAADHAVLDRAVGPVIDVGCGPGRHVLALSERGVVTLGVDITWSAVYLARARGLPVLERSIFDRVPMAGRWRTALLLDGNVGIGGDPVGLLRRVVALLDPGGAVLAELDAPGSRGPGGTVRLDLGGELGPWFGWRPVSVDELEQVASRSALRVHDMFGDDERWFAELRPG